MPLNFFSCFKPPVPDAGPSTSTAGPSTSRATEGANVDAKKKKKQKGYDQLAKDSKKYKLNFLKFEVGSSSQSQNTEDIESFSLEELQDATANFSSECLGKGGFGMVYKGHLENQDAAIKDLDLRGGQGIRQFVMEVEVLRRADHPNLVKLLGFCAKGPRRLLVYEYMALGSLLNHLFDLNRDNPPLDWKTRYKIAIDVACGLEYLHDRMVPSIIHLDVKSSNILLGEEYHAKLSDFGTARVASAGYKTIAKRKIMDSPGYSAPEYSKKGHVSHKADIYSFGVVLLELITGRMAYDPRRLEGEQYLVEWARPLFRIQDRIVQLADSRLEVQYNMDSLNGALELAERCLNSKPEMRPVIVEVVQDLNNCQPP